jgi:hypothetical protein
MEKILEDLVSDEKVLENDIKMHQKCIKNAKKRLKMMQKLKESEQKMQEFEKKCKVCGATKDLKTISQEENLYGCKNDWVEIMRNFLNKSKVKK